MNELQNKLAHRLAMLKRGEIPTAQIVKDLRESGLIDRKGNAIHLTESYREVQQ